jgi:hypothetical protein
MNDEPVASEVKVLHRYLNLDISDEIPPRWRLHERDGRAGKWMAMEGKHWTETMEIARLAAECAALTAENERLRNGGWDESNKRWRDEGPND